MRRSQTLLGVALAVVLTGCGGEPLKVPVAATPMPTLPVLTSVPWTLVGVDDRGLLATVETADDGCHDVDGATIRTSATAVTLTLLGTVTGTCRPTRASLVHAIRLPEPLGTRVLQPGP